MSKNDDHTQTAPRANRNELSSCAIFALGEARLAIELNNLRKAHSLLYEAIDHLEEAGCLNDE